MVSKVTRPLRLRLTYLVPGLRVPETEDRFMKVSSRTEPYPDAIDDHDVAGHHGSVASCHTQLNVLISLLRPDGFIGWTNL